MKVLLADATGDFSLYSIRLFSALLKREGHIVKTLFLLPNRKYTDRQFEQVHEVLEDVDLVLISVYSFVLSPVIQFTRFIHQHYDGLKVIWGGPHCVAAPEMALRFADGVCYADGETAVVELVNRLAAGEDYLQIKNMAFRVDGKNLINGLTPPIADLDCLPLAVISLENQYFLDEGLKEIHKRDLCFHLPWNPAGAPTLMTLTMRGCPFKCTYCSNSCYIKMYGKNPIRFVGIDHALDELEIILDEYHFFSWVSFPDDDFFIRSTKKLEEFAEKYKRRIGLPFVFQTSGNTFSRRKMDITTSAGGKLMRVGLQSASERVLKEVFKRPISAAKVKHAIEELEYFRQHRGLTVLVDFIIDNPYETEKDIVESYKFICNLPKNPVRVMIFNLVLFPGTEIFDRAAKDGFIDMEVEDSSRRFVRSKLEYQKNYPTFMIHLARSLYRRRLLQIIPKFILYALVSPPILWLMHLVPKVAWVKLVRRMGRKKQSAKMKYMQQAARRKPALELVEE